MDWLLNITRDKNAEWGRTSDPFAGQDRRHLNQQRSYVKDPFGGLMTLGSCESVWKEAFGSRTLQRGESAYWREKPQLFVPSLRSRSRSVN